MKLLFLDIDGVLNDHTRLSNGLSTIQPDKADRLNRILATVPDLQVVVSSAWRYYVHNGYMTMEGFTLMLQTHGLHVHERIHGITDPDPEIFIPGDHKPPFDEEYWRARGIRWRAIQIFEYWAATKASPKNVVLDDLPLDLANLIQTDPSVGLTNEHVEQVIEMLSSEKEASA